MTFAWLKASGLEDVYLPAFRFRSERIVSTFKGTFKHAKVSIGDSSGKVIDVEYRESERMAVKSGWQELIGADWKLKCDHRCRSLAVESAGIPLCQDLCEIRHRHLPKHHCEFEIGDVSVYAALPLFAPVVNWNWHRFAHCQPHGERTWCLRMVADNIDDLPRDMANYPRFKPPPRRGAAHWNNTTALGCILIACLALGIEDSASS